MSNSTKEFHDTLMSTARRIVGEFGIERLDALTVATARRFSLAFASQLIDETGCGRDAARRSIARAARQLRHPDFADEASRWGRPRKEQP